MNQFGNNPLASDEYLHARPPGSEFAAPATGLDLNRAPLPGQEFSAPRAGGLNFQGMPAGGNEDLISQLTNFTPEPLLQPAAPSTEPQMFFSPSTGEMVVNGFRFNQRNATAALASAEYARQPRQQFTLPDNVDDWRPISAPEYQSYIESIRNPSYGRRISEAWETGWRGFGDTAVGAGLAINPNWEWGQEARQNLAREFEENAPFIMRMRDVRNPGEALTYASQAIVQAAPWFVETIASMAAGALVGGAVSGGVGAPAGAVEGFIAKEGLRRGLALTIRQNLARGARAYAAAIERRGVQQLTRQEVIDDAVTAGTASADDVNRFFDFGERAYHLSRGSRVEGSIAGSRGAVVGGFASNYMTGVGDIRNTIADAGGDPTTAEAAAQIWGMALPYAAVESLGDLVMTQPLTHVFPDLLPGASRVGNALRGAATGFAAEGGEEGAQYVITQNAAAQTTDTPISLEPIDLLEQVVAGGLGGAGIGGVMGAIGPRVDPSTMRMPGPTTSTPAGSPPGGPIGPTGLEPTGGLEFDYPFTPEAAPAAMVPGGVEPTGGMEFDYPFTQNVPNALPRTITPNAPVVLNTPYRSTAVPTGTPSMAGLTPTNSAWRNPVEIMNDLAAGKDVSTDELQQLRAAVEQLRREKPTGANYSQALSEIDDRIAAATTPAGTSVAPEPAPTERPMTPMEAARSPTMYQEQMRARAEVEARQAKAQEAQLNKLRAESDRAGPIKAAGDGLRGRTEEAPIVPALEAKPRRRIGMAPQPSEPAATPEFVPSQEFTPANAPTAEAKQEALKKGKRSEQRRRARERKREAIETERAIRDTERAAQEEQAREERRKNRKPLSREAQEVYDKYFDEKGRVRAKQGEEKSDAVQERSAEEVPVRKQPRTGERVREGNTEREEATRARPEQKGNEKVQAREVDNTPEDVKGTAVDRKRVDQVYEAGKNSPEYPTLFSFLQAVRGLYGRNKGLLESEKSTTVPITTTKKWAMINGKPITIHELRAIKNRLEKLEINSRNPNGDGKPAIKKATPKADSTETKAVRYGEDLSAEFKRTRKEELNPANAFKEYILASRKEAVAWLASEDAKLRKPLAAIVKDVLDRDLGTKPEAKPAMAAPSRKAAPFLDPAVWGDDQGRAAIKARSAMRQALMRGARELRNSKDKLAVLGNPGVEPELHIIDSRGSVYKATNPVASLFVALMRRMAGVRDATVDKAGQNARFEPDLLNANGAALIETSNNKIEIRMPEQINRYVAKQLQIVVESSKHNNIRVVQLSKDGKGTRENGKSVALTMIQSALGQDVAQPAMSDNIGPSRPGKFTVRSVKETVKKVQNNINPNMRYRNVYVVQDVQELLNRAEELPLTDPGGRIISLADVGAALDPQGDYKSWIKHSFSLAKAVNILYYNALVVVVDNLHREANTNLLDTLEHEYVVHNGLSVIFPDDIARGQFLHRVGAIPGMEQKRQELLFQKPWYRHLTYTSQIEEVIAFHAMEGPLALERLLSVPEGIDQETRRTLWEDLKRMVAEWIEKVFGVNGKAEVDKALDIVIAALREHAIVGTAVDLNQRLDAIGAPSFADIFEKTYGVKLKDFIRPAIVSTTMTDTMSVLYGTETDPGRIHYPTPWTTHMRNVFQSNAPLVEKLQEFKTAGTAVREAIRKVSRNVETMNNMALRSVLVQKTMDIMHNTIDVARQIMSKRLETRQYAIDASPKQNAAYDKIAVVATNHKMPLTTEKVIKAAPRLVVKGPTGLYSINDAVADAMITASIIPRSQLEEGVEQYVVHGDGQKESTGVAKLSKEILDTGYEIYEKETRHMAEAKIETLKHALVMLNELSDATVADLAKQNAPSSVADQAFLNDMLHHMYKLYSDIAFSSKGSRNKNKVKAREVLVELMRTMHNKDKLDDWTDPSKEPAKGPRRSDAFRWREAANPHPDVAPYVTQVQWFLATDPTTGTSRLARLHSLGVGKNQQYDMLTAFQGLLNSETMARKHEEDAIQTILGNYVEFSRKGHWRVFVDVRDGAGNPIDIPPALKAVLPVTYTSGQREAQTKQKELGKEFSDTYTLTDQDGKELTFDIGYEWAPGTQTIAEAPNVKDFLRVADVIGLKLNAMQMQLIGNLLENAAGRKRLGLQRAGTPGMDSNILRNNSEYMTRQAWLAAKMSQAHMFDRVFDDPKNIYGDFDHLKELQAKFDIANRGAPEGTPPPAGFVRNEAQVYLAEKELLEYANQLRYMAKHMLSRPNVVIRTTKGEQKFKIEPEGNAHRAHAIALKESLDRNQLELNLNDLLSKTGQLRMVSVVSSLGSVAAGIMNAFTPLTHLPHYLGAFNEKTGFGEGHAYADIIPEIISAIVTVGKPLDMIHSINIKKRIDEAKAGTNNTGMTLPELEALYDQTLNGELAAQQTYSMTGGTESNITNRYMRRLAEALMAPFSAVEASTRRIAWLVAYRLAKRRYIAAGVSEDALNDHDSPEYKRLKDDTTRVIRNTQFDYANVNRPKIFRGDIAQYFMQFKMFPLSTVLLIANLPVAQQALILGTLFLLAGLKGEPFADDFADIYDTLLQKLGFRHDSVELQLVQLFEEILPGSSKWIMYGGIDAVAFGGTMSSRVSMGDIIPFTGALREGADFGRELEAAIGPAYSSNKAALEYAWVLTDFTMQAMGLKPQVTNWRELIHKMPQAQARGIGEAALMAADGEITDPQGRRTSDDVTAGAIFMRALGFYPLESTKANTAVRLDRMHTGYMRAVRARFILSYANAYRHNDQHTMDSILNSIREWNDAAEQTGQDDMRIRNFRSAALRAGRAAQQTTIERTSSSAPNYSLIDDLAEIINADTESED